MDVEDVGSFSAPANELRVVSAVISWIKGRLSGWKAISACTPMYLGSGQSIGIGVPSVENLPAETSQMFTRGIYASSATLIGPRIERRTRNVHHH